MFTLVFYQKTSQINMVKYYGFFNMKYLLWSTGNTISNFKVCFLFLIVIKFDTPELNNFE